MTECPMCGGELATWHRLCPGCVAATRNRLADVPSLLRELDITISRQSSRGEGGGGDRVDFNVRASDARAALVHVLATYGAHLPPFAIMTRADLLTPVTPAYRAQKLAECGNLGSQEWAPDFACDLARVTIEAWESVDRPPATRFIGWCPGRGGTDCNRALYARDGLSAATCGGCGARWPVEESRAALLLAASDAVAPASTLARALGIPSSTIRSWRRRGMLHPAGSTGSNQPAYRVSDVKRLHMGMRLVGRSGGLDKQSHACNDR